MKLDCKQHIVTKEDIYKSFRCHLCGHKFCVGENYRWVYANGRTFELEGKKYGVCNFFTCETCDGKDVIDRMIDMHKELYTRFWWVGRVLFGREDE